MTPWDNDWLNAIADVLTDLAAAWFALLLVTPVWVDGSSAEVVQAVIMNIGYGLSSLWIAVKLRRMVHEN